MNRCMLHLFYWFILLSISAYQRAYSVWTNNKEVDFDRVVNLMCKPDDGRAVWMLNGNPITTLRRSIEPTHKKHVSFTRPNEGNNYDITIRHFKKSYEGFYECIDKNDDHLSSYDVKMTEAAKIKQISKDLVAMESESVVLWCNATGVPAPDIMWYLVGEHGVPVDIGIKGRKLQIRNISRDCAAIYRCSATNALTKDQPVQKDIHVSVHYTPDIQGIEILEGEDCPGDEYMDSEDTEADDLDEFEGHIGESVSFICHWSASQLMHVKWQKSDDGFRFDDIGTLDANGNVVKPSNTNIPNINFETCDTNTFKLTITSISEAHFSTYKCMVKNKYGEDEFSVKLIQTS